ncbi:TcdA/TcdB pore-forming domain-containing protein [Spirobacillus cienkowskii]|uniref:TcdA/TcdB pore-forming domain-containing protein n=1 Tax=Spirobacillus cienkowskii TaxID=495820 RepID=UPI0030CD9BA3
MDKLIDVVDIQHLIDQNPNTTLLKSKDHINLLNLLSAIDIIKKEATTIDLKSEYFLESISKLEKFELALKNSYNFLFKNIHNNHQIASSLKNLKEVDKNIFMFLNAEETSKNIATKYINIINNIKLKNTELTNDYHPIFYGSNDKEKSILFIKYNKDEIVTNSTIKITLEENEYNEFKYFKDYFNNMSTREIPRLSFYHNLPEHEANLGKAFAMQALFQYFSRTETEHDNSSLSKILLAHSYLNLSQVGLDLLSEGSKIFHLVKILNNHSELLRINYLGNAISSLGSLIGIASIALDIAEITHSQNQLQRSVFGTQLFFDSAGVALGLSSMLGGASVAALTNPLSIPLAGIGIGVTAIVQQSALDNLQALESAKIFNAYKNDHNFNRLTNVNSGMSDNSYISFASVNSQENSELSELNSAVIKELNLSDTNLIKIKYGNSYIAKTKYAELAYGFYKTFFPPFHSNPSAIDYNNFVLQKNLNKDDYLNIREQLEIKENTEYINTNKTLNFILPITPETYYSYTYNTTPNFKERFIDTKETEAVTQLQNKGEFLFVYQYDNVLREYAIRSLKRRFEDTEIKIILGKATNHLITPEIPDFLQNKVTYLLEGHSGGEHVLLLRKGVNYKISSSGKEVFILDISQLTKEFDKIEINNNIISIDNNNIYFNKKNQPASILLRDSNDNIVEVDLNKNLMQYILHNNQHEDIKSLKNYLNKLHSFSNLKKEGYIEITNFPVQSIRHHDEFKAWYDISKNKFIYPIFTKNNECIEENICIEDNIQYSDIYFIGKYKNNLYFFYKHSNEICVQNDLNGNTCTTLLTNIKKTYLFNNILTFNDYNKLVCSIDLNSNAFTFCQSDDPNSDVETISKNINNNINLTNQKTGYFEIKDLNINNHSNNLTWFDAEKSQIFYIEDQDYNEIYKILGKINGKYYFIDKTSKNVYLQTEQIDQSESNKNAYKVLIEPIAFNVKNAFILNNQLFVEDENNYTLFFDSELNPNLIAIENSDKNLDSIHKIIHKIKKVYNNLKLYDVILIRNNHKNYYFISESNKIEELDTV